MHRALWTVSSNLAAEWYCEYVKRPNGNVNIPYDTNETPQL